MYDWVKILSKQWYRTLSTHEITWICCELNGLSREVKFHQCSNNFTSGTTNISSYLNIYPLIDKSRLAIDGTKMSLKNVLLNFFYQYISNIYSVNKNLSLASRTEYDNMFSDPGVGSYIFIFPPQSGSRPRWENLPSGYQHYLLKQLNFRCMYCSQKHLSE